MLVHGLSEMVHSPIGLHSHFLTHLKVDPVNKAHGFMRRLRSYRIVEVTTSYSTLLLACSLVVKTTCVYFVVYHVNHKNKKTDVLDHTRFVGLTITTM